MLTFTAIDIGAHRTAGRRVKTVLKCSATREELDRDAFKRVLPTIVKVHCAACVPNVRMPWLSEPVDDRTGTGFLIGAREILTSAHMLSHHATVSVELPAQSKHNSRRIFPAQVVIVADEVDLALLTVEDDQFWLHVSIRLGLQVSKRLARPGDEVHVVRAAVGGIEKGGYVSRALVNSIDVHPYLYGGTALLALEVIGNRFEPGVSGSPVVNGAQVVGMIHQRSANDAGSAHAVPGPLIQKFVEDYEMNRSYLGVCTFPVTTQKMENESLRRSVGMNSLETGVMVTGFRQECDAMRKIACGDVILEVDRIRVANDGTIALSEEGERVHFEYLAGLHPPDDEWPVKILRDGTEMVVSVKLSRAKKPEMLTVLPRSPPYLVYAGFVFVVLSYPYLQSWGEDWIYHVPENLMRAKRRLTRRAMAAGRNEVIVVSTKLADRINMGYEGFEHRVVERVNGEAVRNLQQMYKVLQKADGEFVRFDLEDGLLLVVGRDAAHAANRRIMEKYRIPQLGLLGEDTEEVIF
mmetsp:Transcript_4929/g.14837  ORF Transcript_4929/g.14837 Transcript_4929/m.14837 type:complete len:522 (+) Transcript_4929:366-1931(+)|eukprot:CAMPEP_0198729462 /NCGR_PEP_ID=MMETSP1475-20131203/18465_1 /TAXON_ID= ORGANISM="Unidentified sp., Strain CCMP1999" /NCGR_SAMPLE_ID=MMETSP1475 /ASSEMBLY_ACC=CAM_ASM_001111 /LENGTH=521 /DNA_ID=CAMNT_0044492121 /DNA_START=309 /DNA_END=1874 /DNA_ORIENTATION=+